MTLKRIN